MSMVNAGLAGPFDAEHVYGGVLHPAYANPA